MSAELIAPASARSVARELFLLLHRGQEAWFDVAWEAWGGGTSVDEWTHSWRTLPGLGASGGPDLATQQMARDFAAMATTFLIESPTARNALLARLKEASDKRGHAKAIREWLTQAAEEILSRPRGDKSAPPESPPEGAAGDSSDYVVWHVDAHDIACGESKRFDQKTVASRFWDKRQSYDLFIYGRLVLAPKRCGDRDIELTEDKYRALVALLLHKGNPLRPLVLYRVAARNESLVQGLSESDVLTSHIKPLVSRLRKQLSPVVPAFKIPDKRKREGYAIQGAFSVCVVLPCAEAVFFQQLLESARIPRKKPA